MCIGFFIDKKNISRIIESEVRYVEIKINDVKSHEENEERIIEIKVVKKHKLTPTGDVVTGNDFYGINIVDNGKLVYVTYPFTLTGTPVAVLEDFIEHYKEELIDCYCHANSNDFCRHVLGYDTDLKTRFKERWYKEGIIIN